MTVAKLVRLLRGSSTLGLRRKTRVAILDPETNRFREIEKVGVADGTVLIRIAKEQGR